MRRAVFFFCGMLPGALLGNGQFGGIQRGELRLSTHLKLAAPLHGTGAVFQCQLRSGVCVVAFGRGIRAVS